MITRETFTYRTREFYFMLSSDDKPITGVPNGSELTEIDTGKKYMFNEPVGWCDPTAKRPVSISISTPPTKTSYYDGDDFDPTGMVVTAAYTDSSTDTVTDYSVSPETLSLDVEKVTVTYINNGIKCIAEQAVTVAAIELDSIEWTTAPDKTEYSEGEALDLTGAVITATYNNGDTATVTELCEFTPANGTELSETDVKVTASYTDGEITKTADQAITVTAQEAEE